MRIEAQATVRNVGLLLLQRGGHVGAALLFAVLVPRLMGPEIYGRYALITSLATWFGLLSGLGFVEVIGRHVPALLREADGNALRKLLGNLLAVRLASATVASALYLSLTTPWLRDLDPLVLVLAAASVLVRGVASLFIALFLGLNQAARSGLGELLRRWVLLAALLPGFHFGGLRGACWALLGAELATLAIALSWGRSYFAWSSLRLDARYVAPYLRLGLFFFGSHLCLVAFQGSGEALVRIASRDYAQVSYFGLAHSVYLTAAFAIPQLTLTFAPLLITLRADGQVDALGQWVDRLVKCLAMGAVLTVFGALFLGEDLVPLILGAPYRPVAINLVPLALTLSTAALSGVGNLLALTHDRPRVALIAAVIRLVGFWSLGPVLAAWQGSFGGCLAVLGASALYAAYLTWRMRDAMRHAARSWSLTTGLGGLFLPLLWLRSSWLVNAALCGACILGYTGLVLRLGVITKGELIAAWRAITPRAWAPRPRSRD